MNLTIEHDVKQWDIGKESLIGLNIKNKKGDVLAWVQYTGNEGETMEKAEIVARAISAR